MSTIYIEKPYFNEFQNLIETLCPYKLEIFKYNDVLYFHKKWLYCNKNKRRERFKDLNNYILRTKSYIIECSSGIIDLIQYIKTYEDDDFDDFEQRSLTLNNCIYAIDSTFLNVFKEAEKILKHETYKQHYENIADIIIYFYSSILCFKAEHGEYINVTKPIKDEFRLEELDNFIRLNSEELYLNILCTKCW